MSVDMERMQPSRDPEGYVHGTYIVSDVPQTGIGEARTTYSKPRTTCFLFSKHEMVRHTSGDNLG